jgi:hypothetical protein
MGVALAPAAQLGRVGDDHLVPQALQQTTDPGRVRAGLQDHASAGQVAEVLLQRGSRRRNAAALDDLASFVQMAEGADSIAHIEPDG